MNKRADTPLPILDAIASRWSPRAFTNDLLNEQEINTILEAARWAASSMNEQPWRFIYAHRGEKEHQQIVDSLMEGNQSWASKAPVLMLTLAKTTFSKNGKKNSSAIYDLGLAVGNLSIQASEMNIGVHQMGGLYPEKAKELFEVNDDYVVVTAMALGKYGDPNQLDEPLRSRELSARNRQPLNKIAYHGKFNN